MLRSTLVTLCLVLLVNNVYAQANDNNIIKEIKINLTEENLEHPHFKELEDKYIGQIIEENAIPKIEKKLARFFIKKDYLLPQVKIRIKHQVLEIDVTPKTIAKITVFNDGPDNKLINEYIAKILANKHPRTSYVEKYIALMNRVPGYLVDHQYRATKNIAQTELILSISKPRGDLFASVDSYGSSETGRMENFVSGNLYNDKGGSDAWSFSSSTTNYPERFYSVSAGYASAINNIGTNASFTVAHSENNTTLQDNVHTTNGTDNSINANLSHLLYFDIKQNIEANLSADYKSSIGYTLNSSNGNVDDTKSNYLSSTLAFKYSLIDELQGQNTVTVSFSQGIVGVLKDYTDPTQNADEHYNLYQIDIVRNQKIISNFSLNAHFQAGHSDHTLPSSEMYSIGGRSFGRGYDSGLLAGRKIIAIAHELRYDYEFENNQWLQSAQPYVFHDTGYVGSQSANGTSISRLSSYGGGVRFSIIYDIDLEGEIAQPTKMKYNLYDTPTKSTTVYSAMISKSFSF